MHLLQLLLFYSTKQQTKGTKLLKPFTTQNTQSVVYHVFCVSLYIQSHFVSLTCLWQYIIYAQNYHRYILKSRYCIRLFCRLGPWRSKYSHFFDNWIERYWTLRVPTTSRTNHSYIRRNLGVSQSRGRHCGRKIRKAIDFSFKVTKMISYENSNKIQSSCSNTSPWW